MPKSNSYPRLTEAVNHPLLKGITETRLSLFTNGHFASQNLSSILERQRIDSDEFVQLSVWSAPGESKPSFQEAVKQLGQSGNLKPYRKGDRLGLSWTNHWVRALITIPKTYRMSSEPVIFEFDPGCEALLFTPSGEAIHAITGGPDSNKEPGVPVKTEDRRVEHVIPRSAIETGYYELIIEVSCNGMFGVGMNGYRHQRPDPNKSFQLASADIILVNSQAVALELDFQTLRQVSSPKHLEHSSVSHRALKAANDIMNTFGASDHFKSEEELDEVVERCRGIASPVLGNMGEEERKKLCTFDKESGPDAKMWAIGHCHIDTAWLWTYSVTQQKIARSWSTQIDLMHRFPNHQFAASSAQQYYWLEKLYPDVFDKVKTMVTKEQRFIPVGGSWLEHDCILPSGESLCRQYLYGQRYFAEKFDGFRCREAWLPDTFGYASQLPQILRLAGLEFFFTQKLSWNNINVFPYSTFNWVSLDGSQVLAHMTPVESYSSQCNYDELVNGVGNNKNLGVTDECLLLFGNGDGGGGPTPRMLNKLERLSALSLNNPAEIPQIKIGKPSQFFESLKRKTDNGEQLPTWRGELYFELHRGTYTSQADIKKGNRFLEKALRDLEYYGTVASIYNPKYRFPKDKIDDAWRDTMLGQFHDVLPGTSIRKTNVDTIEMHARQLAIVEGLIEEALSAAIPSSVFVNGHTLGNEGNRNLIGIDPIRLGRREVVMTNGNLVFMESDSDGIAHVTRLPRDTQSPKAYKEGSAYVLENRHFKLTISNGRITSLIDIPHQREMILAGSSATNGGLMTYDDFPTAYDAWDAEIYHLDCKHVIDFTDVEVALNDPLRASLRATAKFGKSTVTLTFSLDAVPPNTDPSTRSWIRIDTIADWHETHKFLKFVLPVDIHSPYATYDTQFGLIDRPTHRNTTVDQAKFEVVAHRFADLSETGYGVSLVADHKYGYAVEGNVMRLSLLRSSTAPDPEQDMGMHHFSFAIMPHVGRLVESAVPKDALRFTNPIRIRQIQHGQSNFLQRSKFEITGPRSKGIILETIKRGEDDDVMHAGGEKVVIMRLYEGLGGKAKGTLELAGLRAKSVSYVNILEELMPEGQSDVEWKSDEESTSIELDVRAFEIKTLKIVL